MTWRRTCRLWRRGGCARGGVRHATVQWATRGERTPVGPGGRRRAPGRRGRARRRLAGRALGRIGDVSVLALALDPTTPTTVYAGTEGGVFKSTDGGGSWNAVNTGMTCGSAPIIFICSVAALALDPTTPTTLYAGTLGGVFKTTDGGASWQPGEHGAGEPLRPCPRPRPHDPDHRSTPGRLGGVFKTTDGGASWSPVNTGLASLNVHRPRPRPHDPDHPLRGDADSGAELAGSSSLDAASSRPRTGARAGAR